MSSRFLSTPLIILLVSSLLLSCGSYRQNIMFQVPASGSMQKQIESVEKNYVVQRNDYLTVRVFTNEGERLIDPDFKLMKDNAGQSVNNIATRPQNYLVDQQGIVKLPMVGEIKIEGLTLKQAEEMLQQEYSKFYQQPFVVLEYQNKRVIVLGAPGGQVIPLLNENVTLVEVLALAKGVGNDAKAHNIRVLRGDKVMTADLSTFEGYVKDNIVMVPGDVVYVEPIRRPFVESVRDYGPVITILTSLTTLIIVTVGL